MRALIKVCGRVFEQGPDYEGTSKVCARAFEQGPPTRVYEHVKNLGTMYFLPLVCTSVRISPYTFSFEYCL